MAEIINYTQKLVGRIITPVSPLFLPVLKPIQIWQIIISLIFLVMAGNWQNWQIKKQYQQELAKKNILLKKLSDIENILLKKPYYRDILIKASWLAWQIKSDEKAKELWEKANYLDPNDPTVQDLKKVISFPL